VSVLRTIEEVAATISEAAATQPGQRLIVAIVGPPGAGKSTIAEAVVDRLNRDAQNVGIPDASASNPSGHNLSAQNTDHGRWMSCAALLPMDGFHLPQKTLVELGRRDRMGAPDTFDVDGFLGTLHALTTPAASRGVRAAAAASAPGPAEASAFGNSGTVVTAPGFDREVEEAVPGQIVIPPGLPIVIVEGNYLLLQTHGWEAVAPLLDLSFSVELARDERLRRLVDRHIRFGKAPEAARAWALGPDEANAVLVAATSTKADHTIAL
jgi:pantothenate kinase